MVHYDNEGFVVTPDLKSIDTIYMFLAFVVPGLTMTFVLAQFTTGRVSPYSEIWPVYLAKSAVYYALILPVVEFMVTRRPGYWRAVVWVLLVFVGPALIGLLLGLNARHGFVRRLLGRLQLPTVHVMPTAWDWKFSDNHTCWLLVILKDGTQFAGFFGSASFASSDPAERDLYLEKVYDLDDDGRWIDRGDKGVLLLASEIRSIEIFPDKKGVERGN